MENDRKFLFDVNIFDAPPKEEIIEDLPPPPPVFSEDELSAAKDMAFEQGRQLGQKEQIESREQYIAQTLDKIAQSFSKLFAAEIVRESIFEKEALRLSIATLDLIFPVLTEKLGQEEVTKVIEKTLTSHRKTKEINICIPEDTAKEVESLIARIRVDDHDKSLWRITENHTLLAGDCTLEWSDGGAVRDSVRTAHDIRKNITAMLGEDVPKTIELEHSEVAQSIVLSKDLGESSQTHDGSQTTMTGEKE